MTIPADVIRKENAKTDVLMNAVVTNAKKDVKKDETIEETIEETKDVEKNAADAIMTAVIHRA